jgi:hypothetical protein
MKVRLLLAAGMGALGLLACLTAVITLSNRAKIPYLPVPALMQACEVTSQCMLVETRCDRCCGYAAIAAAHVEAYMEMYSESCRLYDLQSSHRDKGHSEAFALNDRSACNCFMPDTLPMCLYGFCALSALPEP